MCRLFVNADPNLWQSQTRSMRIEGMATSVRLEALFWNVLEELGARDDLTLSQLIARLYQESLDEGRDLENFASFLRVCCARYLSLQLSDDIPKDKSISIRSLDANRILERERSRSGAKPPRTASGEPLHA